MIRKDGNGSRPWRARHKLRGKAIQRSFETKKLAAAWLRQERDTYAREQSGLPVQQGPVTYDDLCELFLANYTAASKPWLERQLQHSRDRFGSTLVHLLRPEQIGAWLHSELDYAPTTKSHILAKMRQVLHAGVEWHYLYKNPASSKAVKSPGDSKTQVFPLESWGEVLAVADAAGYYGPLIRFVCATGLRPGEWSSLLRSEIDRTAGVINVNGSKTSASQRAVVLSKPALSALDDLVSRIDTRYAFVTPTGRKIDAPHWGQDVWRPALALTGLRDRPSYQMRHTYATLALAQGCTLEWISTQLGHTNILITRQRYARFVKRVDDRMRALLDQMEENHDQLETRDSDQAIP